MKVLQDHPLHGLGVGQRAPTGRTRRPTRSPSASRTVTTRTSSTRSGSWPRTPTSSAWASPPGETCGTFFKHETQDDFGTPESGRRGRSAGSIARGVSQSGNVPPRMAPPRLQPGRATGVQVHDGAWPIIAGRRIALELPLGAAGRRARSCTRPGARARVVGGLRGPDVVRDLPRRGILDRCTQSHTCPKIIEHFGAAEVWELKLPIDWVGTDAKRDIPIPRERPPLLHSQHHPRRRPRRLRPQPAPDSGGQLPGQQLGRRGPSAPTRSPTPRR